MGSSLGEASVTEPEEKRLNTLPPEEGRAATDPPAVASGAVLRVTRGIDLGRSGMVGAHRISIGTHPTSDLQLSDPRVSRLHCEIVMRGDAFVIRDLGSTNGTYVDGVQVQEAALRERCVVRIGATELTLQPWTAQTQDAAPGAQYGELVGDSKVMQEVFASLMSVAKSTLTCLLLGETGTGKELAARALHMHSARAAMPFIVVDCAALSAQLIEDKLFGHQRGAFTGASSAAAGVFEEASGGTVFLDEIGELPHALQAKLLGVLERREATRLGSHTPVKLDVRVIAATHRDLPGMVQRGELRQDLLYRLSEYELRMPPLRERVEDIAAIARTLKTESGGARVLTADALSYLRAQRWPGNVRELRNLLRRADVAAQGRPITRELLLQIESVTQTMQIPPPRHEVVAARSAATASGDGSMQGAIEACRRAYLEELRKRYGNDLDAAAAHAGAHPKSVARLYRLYGL